MSAIIENIEQLINVDYNQRGVNRLYPAARQLVDKPICAEIAEQIIKLKAGDYVLLITGSVTRPWVDPRIAETDGPLGTAVLAKKIRELTGAIPIIVCEEALCPSIGAVVQAAGLTVTGLEQIAAAEAKKAQGQTSIAAMLPFAQDDAAARKQAKQVLADLHPQMIICIERAGFNEQGIYHNMRGHDYSAGRARADYLVTEANQQGITTIAVGDGGNEIGMGAIAQAVKEYVPYGAICQCGCGKGLLAATATDILLTASVSNWGCYAICAALAIIAKDARLLHTKEDELRLINTATQVGMVDGNTGQAGPSVDKFDANTNCTLVDFIRLLALRELAVIG